MAANTHFCILSNNLQSENTVRGDPKTGVPCLFADDANHINGIENFWNQAKRHLSRYNGIPRRRFHLCIKECEWRFNYRPAALRFSGFGWLTPVSRATSVEFGVSSDLQSAEAGFRSARADALAKGGPVRTFSRQLGHFHNAAAFPDRGSDPIAERTRLADLARRFVCPKSAIMYG